MTIWMTFSEVTETVLAIIRRMLIIIIIIILTANERLKLQNNYDFVSETIG